MYEIKEINFKSKNKHIFITFTLGCEFGENEDISFQLNEMKIVSVKWIKDKSKTLLRYKYPLQEKETKEMTFKGNAQNILKYYLSKIKIK